MRVTGGSLAGRRLGSVAKGVRPTSDRVRESLFAWIDVWEGARVLDLFAGTGALGVEAISRGAASVVFVDHSPEVLRGLRSTLSALTLEHQSEVRKGDAASIVARLTRSGPGFDVVFLDPPYDSEALEHLLPLLGAGSLVNCDGVIVVERSRHQALPVVDDLKRVETRRYGDTIIDVLQKTQVE